MNVREFLTKWGFQIETEKLDGVEKRLDGIKGRMDLFATAFIATKLFQMAQRFGHLGEQIHIASVSAGIAVEEYQKLGFSAAKANVGTEMLTGGLTRISRALYAAREGSKEAREMFQKAGLDPSKYKNATEALTAFGDRLKAIDDPIKKSALASGLIGRNNAQMVAWLSQGSAAIKKEGEEAQRLGIILDEVQVKTLAGFSNKTTTLAAVLKGLGAVLMVQVIPALNYLIDDVVRFIAANKDLIVISFTKWFDQFQVVAGHMYGILKLLIGTILLFAKTLGIEDDIIPLVMWIGTLTATLFSLAAATKTATFAFGFLKPILVGIAAFIPNLLLSLAVLAEGWGLAAISAKLFAAAVWLSSAPLWAIIGIIAAVVFAVHELWAVLTGNKTWTGSFWDWFKSLKMVQGALQNISDVWAKITGKNLLSGPGVPKALEDVVAKLELNQLRGPQANPYANTVRNTNVGGGKTEINAPITITVPPGTPPNEVGTAVKEGIQEHLDRLMRETRVSTTPTMVY